MKKNLTVLTGIVFVIAMLVSDGCVQSTDSESENKKEYYSTDLGPASKDVDIFLKEKLVDGRMHLEMYDSRDTTKKVVDSLETVVFSGSTIQWKKAAKSEIEAVHHIRLIEADSIFSVTRDSIGLMSLHKLIIPDSVAVDTIKYEIVFTVKHDGGTWCIDPYLRIED